MKTSLAYGSLLALTLFLILLALFLCGVHSDAAKFRLGQSVEFVGDLAAGIGFIVCGIKASRTAGGDRGFSYGQAFGAGLSIQLVASLIGIATRYLYFGVIDPHFGDLMVQVQLDKLQARGVSGDQLDHAEHFLRIFSSPLAMTATGFISSMIFGAIVALIAAAFLKRAASENAPAAA
jgi:hypothetical protein